MCHLKMVYFKNRCISHGCVNVMVLTKVLGPFKGITKITHQKLSDMDGLICIQVFHVYFRKQFTCILFLHETMGCCMLPKHPTQQNRSFFYS